MRGVALVTALVLALSAAPAAVAEPDPPAPALSLPAPTGRHPVGATSLHLDDTSRPDPWVPTEDSRELMVTVFYPATTSNGPRKQYMTSEESRIYLESQQFPGVPLDALSTVETNAVVDARPAAREHSLPLVVLSPGFTNSRATLSSLAEDLASHGYVVAVVDHTYENRATEFPGGRVAACAACEFDHLDGFWQKLVPGRAADVSFVLDELTGAHPAWRGARLIDRSRIAMAGHSAGGASTSQAMVAEPRIRAGINIDGSVHVPLVEPGLSRPFMFMGTMDHYTPGAPGPYDDWERDWQRLTGWKRWVMATGTAHASFTDLGMFADPFGVDIGATIDPYRASDITRAYVRAFLDLHLRGRPQPLMAGPSRCYPEITVVG
ncbi:alpha/beta hydrolase family protein [Actinophytocola xanthii]|uniref:Alpha/beta hydrolase n=1 Tax=Actinophytocola xanthii TaxID=1912961 RepID=A0A1Q8CXF8_9PSEU|nr:alpha/beta hydrolase [Actinophytocola xanthii]OLF19032.1 alpha/beta hydrolase [Actinophytocola xanthii]